MSSRSKKTRKIGRIGVRKDPDFRKKKPAGSENSSKTNKHKGNPAGSRNVVESKPEQTKVVRVNKDPRHGSKKPVQLIKAPVARAAVKKYATPADELAALEADNRLSDLLDKLDEGQAISKAEQQYVDDKMARHRILCDLLGIAESDDEDDDDPMDSLDAMSMDEFKD